MRRLQRRLEYQETLSKSIVSGTRYLPLPLLPPILCTANSAVRIFLLFKGESSHSSAPRSVAEPGGKHIPTAEHEKPITLSSVPDEVRNFNPMAMPDGNTALTTAISAAASKVVFQMNEEQFEAEKDYQASILCFKQMLENAKITQEEYEPIDTILLEKYRPLLGTLFCDNRLT